MNEIQIYSVVMFFAGVILTHAIFFLDRQRKKKRFYILMSACILQVLDSVHSMHMAAVEFAKEEIKTKEEFSREEYLDTEVNKVSVFMELYVLLMIKTVPLEGRKYINYKTWPEAQSLIKELRGLIDDGKSKR